MQRGQGNRGLIDATVFFSRAAENHPAQGDVQRQLCDLREDQPEDHVVAVCVAEVRARGELLGLIERSFS